MPLIGINMYNFNESTIHSHIFAYDCELSVSIYKKCWNTQVLSLWTRVGIESVTIQLGVVIVLDRYAFTRSTN